jgi:tetratricopeptide (TPR) repeat protein
MKRTTRLSAWCTGIGLALTLCATTSNAQDFKTSYRKGLTAIDRGKWSEVARWMDEAVAANPTASTDKIKFYGTRYVEYTPYYYLGLAHYNLGNCAEAVRAWDTAAAQGVADLSDIQSSLEECRRQIVTPTPIPRPTATPAPVAPPPPIPTRPDRELINRAIANAERAIGGAATAETAITQLRTDPEMARAWDTDSTLQREFDEAAGLLSTARDTLQRGIAESDPETLQQAADLAARAERRFERAEPRLTALRSEIDRELQTEAERLAEQRRLELEAAQAAEARPTAITVDRPVAVVATQVPERQPAPVKLRSAAKSYLAGEYAETISILTDPEFSDPRASALALLLRAASRFGLYYEGGEADAGLREMAEDDVRSCRRFDTGITPDDGAFSPRFARFFSQTR